MAINNDQKIGWKFIVTSILVGISEFIIFVITAFVFRNIGQAIWMMDFNPLPYFILIFLFLGFVTTAIGKILYRNVRRLIKLKNA